jgi:hypothetical protein
MSVKILLLAAALAALPAIAADAPSASKPAFNIDLATPPIVVTRHAMAQRASRLVRFYESGEIGLGADGLIYLRDGSKMTLAKRQIAEKLIDNENYERKALVFAIADGHGRRNEQPEVWTLMTQRWHQQWKAGWWLRDDKGNWSRKP